MLREFVMLLSCATVSYLWLCAIVSPLLTAVRSLARQGSDRAAWAAFGLAAAATVVWTAIPLGLVVLAMILEPRAGLALLHSDAGWRGVSLGNIVWAGQLVAFARVPRMPRIGPTFETATALAIVALLNDDARTLSRVERLYRLHAVAPAPSARSAASGAVHSVTA